MNLTSVPETPVLPDYVQPAVAAQDAGIFKCKCLNKEFPFGWLLCFVILMYPSTLCLTPLTNSCVGLSNALFIVSFAHFTFLILVY